MIRTLTLATLLLAALPARADPGAEADAATVEACIATAWPRDARALCTGVVMGDCQAEAGAATGACLAREAAAWEAVMQRQLPELLRRAGEVDAAAGTPRGLDAATATLDAAQRAWAVYRDAECRYAYANWGNGEFRAVAHAACLLDLTARRVVDLHARLVTGG